MPGREERGPRRAARTAVRGQSRARREAVRREAARSGGVAGDEGDSYHHGDLRRALVQGGMALLAREGLAGFSLRALAQELGVSHAAPYRHFASREELLAEILAENNRRFIAALRESVATPGKGGDRIYRLGEAYVRFYLDNPEALALFSMLPAQLASAGDGLRALLAPPSPPGPGGEPGLFQDEGFMLLRKEVAALMSNYPGLSERDVLMGFWAKAHGLAALLAAQPDYFAPEDIDAALARVIRSAF